MRRGGKIRFASVVLLSGTGFGCQSAPAPSRTKSSGLTRSATLETSTHTHAPQTSAAEVCDMWHEGSK